MLTRPMTRGKTFHLSTCKMWLLDRWSLNCPFQNKCYTGLLPCVQILICKSVFHTVNRNAQSSAAVCFRISTYPSPHMFIIYKHTHTHTLLSLTASSRFQDEVEAPWLGTRGPPPSTLCPPLQSLLLPYPLLSCPANPIFHQNGCFDTGLCLWTLFSPSGKKFYFFPTQ